MCSAISAAIILVQLLFVINIAIDIAINVGAVPLFYNHRSILHRTLLDCHFSLKLVWHNMINWTRYIPTRKLPGQAEII